MSAVLVVAGALSWAGLLPTPPVNSILWWLWRIPWLIMLGVVLTVLVAIFGRTALAAFLAGALTLRLLRSVPDNPRHAP